MRSTSVDGLRGEHRYRQLIQCCAGPYPARMDASEPVSAIRNLGPRSVEMFAKAGINNASELRSMGADDAYRKLLQSGNRPHFIGYYALVMGLQGRPWNDLDPIEKAELRARFDQIVADSKTDTLSGIERELDRLGVINRS